MTENLATICGYLLLAFWIFGLAGNILSIGKERKPLTPGVFLVSLIASIPGYYFLIYHLIQG